MQVLQIGGNAANIPRPILYVIYSEAKSHLVPWDFKLPRKCFSKACKSRSLIPLLALNGVDGSDKAGGSEPPTLCPLDLHPGKEENNSSGVTCRVDAPLDRLTVSAYHSCVYWQVSHT